MLIDIVNYFSFHKLQPPILPSSPGERKGLEAVPAEKTLLILKFLKK
ncbi:hypothetical protein HMPREF0494_0675 [Limosilactobacillus antri DSM 16041]|uniref:Uncharacterized protein n=1 Tax=Limosilactobacillus antri DSM 16041 TaxID=525309 RepID=C8P5T1_9LACO|nr:hypothetical protein HMPREF0494_0675 [Limosilactobacillus antri DSM 16041]